MLNSTRKYFIFLFQNMTQILLFYFFLNNFYCRHWNEASGRRVSSSLRLSLSCSRVHLSWWQTVFRARQAAVTPSSLRQRLCQTAQGEKEEADKTASHFYNCWSQVWFRSPPSSAAHHDATRLSACRFLFFFFTAPFPPPAFLPSAVAGGSVDPPLTSLLEGTRSMRK